MCVNPFGDSGSGVPKNHPDGGFVYLCTVKQGSQGMAALVGRVLHPDGVHSFIPEPTEAIVSGAWADYSGLFPLRKHIQDAMMDGDFTDPGGCL